MDDIKSIREVESCLEQDDSRKEFHHDRMRSQGRCPACGRAKKDYPVTIEGNSLITGIWVKGARLKAIDVNGRLTIWEEV